MRGTEKRQVADIAFKAESSKYKTGWQRAMAALAWKLRAELLGHEQV